MVRHIIIVGFIFLSLTQSHAKFQSIEVYNDAIYENGITTTSVEDWLTKKNKKQKKNGKEYFDFLDDRLYLPPDENRTKFLNPDCVKIENLEEDRYPKIILISSNQQCLGLSVDQEWKLSYVIKDLGESNFEIKQLEAVQESQAFQVLLSNSFQFPQPLLALPLNFSFQDDNQDTYFFLMINAAEGIPFKRIMKEGRPDDIKRAYEALGRTFGNMHVHFMDATTSFHSPGISYASNPIRSNDRRLTDYYKTLTHGDAHGENIYFNFKKNQVEMIDNESFANAIKHKLSIEKDLYSIFFSFFSSLKNNPSCSSDPGQICNNLVIAVQSFFNAYINAYPQTEKPALIIYLKLFIDSFLESTLTSEHEKEHTIFIQPHLLPVFDSAINNPMVTKPSTSEVKKKIDLSDLPIQKPITKKTRKENEIQKPLQKKILEQLQNLNQ